MTAPEAQADAAALPRWGVYDRHTGEWPVAPTLASEREAWGALLTVDSLHPWELTVDRATDESAAETKVECPDCWTTGECDSCGRECTRCEGDGYVAWGELAEFERKRYERRTAAGAA